MTRHRLAVFGILLLVLALGAGPAVAQAPQVTPPKPTVPEIFTLMGQYVRVAYNNQGFVKLGYRPVQESIGEEWMLLEVGLTMREPAKNFTLKREPLQVKTPDGSTIGLTTQKQYAEAGYHRALNQRARVGIAYVRSCDRILFGGQAALRGEARHDDSSSTWKGRPGRCGRHP